MRISGLGMVIRESSSNLSSSSEVGKIKSITIGHTRMEFSDRVSTNIESATIEYKLNRK